MRALILFFLLCAPLQAQFLSNLQYTKESVPEGTKIVLTWEILIPHPSAHIGIFRANKCIDLLPGDTTTWEITEPDYGDYTYTVLWIWSWQTAHIYYDVLQVTVELGKLVWDHPDPPDPDGYFIYVSDIEGEFDLDPDVQLGYVNEMPLNTLKDIIISGNTYYLAAASYVEYDNNGQIDYFVSELVMEDNAGNPVEFIWYDKTWPVKKPETMAEIKVDD